ncbi:Sulfate permease family protein 3 [Aphelenchoides bicaudatus]|nr:Sulfate permease family protein 3 [Aphelenchoides bicaudatus]
MAGILNITQGIAYAVMAGLPPVSGLYSTFLSILIYPFLASWPHGSLGPFAIVELMSGAAARRVMHNYGLDPNANLTNDELILLEEINPSTIISTLTFMNGFVCLAFGFLHLQFLMRYFSDSFVSGFITAVSLHVFVAQIDVLIGIKRPRSSGIGYLFVDIYETYKRIHTSNYLTLTMSMGSLLFLIIGKFLIHPFLQKAFSLKKLVLPWELLLVILTTSIAYFLRLDTEFDLKVVGNLPTGLPEPSLPKFYLIPELFWDSIAISVTQLAFHLSVAKIMSADGTYKVDDRQETYAIGSTLIFTGFFPVFPGTNGLGRPMVLRECGATTPIACIISGLVVLVVLLAVGPVLYWLPLCVLSVILLVAIRGLLRGFCRVRHFWRMSKWDGLIWMVTFVSSVGMDVIGGLVVGVLFQAFTVVWRAQWPQWGARFSKNKHSADLCIFEYHSMVLFTNSEHFEKAARRVLVKWNASGLGRCQRTFIFNFAAISHIDTMGLESLYHLVGEIRQAACVVYFANIQDNIASSLKRAQIISEENTNCIFQSIEDAIWAARLPDDHLPLIAKTTNPFDFAYDPSVHSLPFTNL